MKPNFLLPYSVLLLRDGGDENYQKVKNLLAKIQRSPELSKDERSQLLMNYAVADWKLAFNAVGTPVDDFAALLSDATVFQFIARPTRDLEGVRLLGTSLMLNGIAMEVCGSSRPASGSEHLISHALDSLGSKPRMHGLQVGVATYLVSLLQKQNSATIADLFEKTGFWRAIERDPFRRADWLEALRRAPAIKQDFYTVLSSRDCRPEAEEFLRSDPRLRTCVVD